MSPFVQNDFVIVKATNITARVTVVGVISDEGEDQIEVQFLNGNYECFGPEELEIL